MVVGLSFPGENRRTQVDQLQGEGGSLLLLCQAKLSWLQSPQNGEWEQQKPESPFVSRNKGCIVTFLLILKYLLSFHNEPNTVYKISNEMVLALWVSFKSTVITVFSIVKKFVFWVANGWAPPMLCFPAVWSHRCCLWQSRGSEECGLSSLRSSKQAPFLLVPCC